MKKYKVCRYSDFCSYDHEVGDTSENSNTTEIDDMKKSMDEMKNVIEKQKLDIQTLCMQVTNLEKALLNRPECLERDDDDLEIESESSENDEALESNTEYFPEVNEFSCEQCDYQSKTEAGVKIHIGKKHKSEVEFAPIKNVFYEHFEMTRKVNKPNCLAVVRKNSKPADFLVLIHSVECWEEKDETRCTELMTAPPIVKDIPMKDNKGLLHILASTVIFDGTVDWDDIFRSMVGFDLDCWRN